MPPNLCPFFGGASDASFSAPLGCPLATGAKQPSLLLTEFGAKKIAVD